MAEWKRGGPAFSVALIEVCQYGDRGENRGQPTQEMGSRTAARCLLATIREMDLLGSYTPDCFALMMPTAGLADAVRVVDRLSAALLQHIALASGERPVFVLSVGVVQAMESDDATSVLKRAETALDAAERKGGNRVYCHDGERIAPVAAILEMESAGCLA
jgi:diguanylate cyclase (GGDEF)-like protein